MSFQESPKNWEPPDGLGYSSLRPVRLSRLGIALAVIGGIMLVGAPVLGLVVANQSYNAAERQRLLHEQGVETKAVILRLWRDGENSEHHMVSYRFDAGEGKASVPSSIWRTLRTGTDLPVRYVPAHPKINHPAGWPVSQTPIWLAWLAGATLAIPAALFVFLIRKQMRLLSEGRPAPGVITRVKRSGETVSVRYEFTLLSGAVMKGRSGGGRKTPEVGSPCCVLYDPENPKRSAIYPLQLVSLDR